MKPPPSLRDLDAQALLASPLALLIASVVAVSVLAWLFPSLKAALILSPRVVVHGRQVHRLLTAGWLHADSTHLFFNMLTLYLFADEVIGVLGAGTFLALYVSAVVVAFVPTTLRHRDRSGYASLGASGAVSAVMISATLLHPGLELYPFFLPFRVPGLIYALIYMGYSVWHSWTSGAGDRINHDAHLSGAAYGALVTYALEPARVTSTVERVF